MPPAFVAILRAAKECGPIPVYATEAWNDLPAQDPRRLAAVIIAAECWAGYKAETTERVAAELAAEQTRSLLRWGDACQDVRGVERMDNSPRRNGDPFAILQERRKS